MPLTLSLKALTFKSISEWISSQKFHRELPNDNNLYKLNFSEISIKYLRHMGTKKDFHWLAISFSVNFLFANPPHTCKALGNFEWMKKLNLGVEFPLNFFSLENFIHKFELWMMCVATSINAWFFYVLTHTTKILLRKTTLNWFLITQTRNFPLHRYLCEFSITNTLVDVRRCKSLWMKMTSVGALRDEEEVFSALMIDGCTTTMNTFFISAYEWKKFFFLRQFS